MEALQNWLLNVALDQLLQILVPILIAWAVTKFPWVKKILDAIVANQQAAATVRRELAIDQVADRAVMAVEQKKKVGEITTNTSAKQNAVNEVLSKAVTDSRTANVAVEAAVNRMNKTPGVNDKRLDELEGLLNRNYEN